MKKRHIIFLLALLTGAALCCACGGGNEVTPDDPDRPVPKRTELILSTSVEAATKADFPDADTQLPARETVSVWVHEATSATPQLYGNILLTANGSGGLSGEKRMYFPENGNPVHIYALHANPLPDEEAYPGESLTHTVSADQREAGKHAASDLLYARKTDVGLTSKAVPLPFRHLLAQVKIALFLEGDLAKSEVESVTIEGIRRQALYTLDRSLAPENITVAPAGKTSAVRIGTDLSFNADRPKYNAAVIVPQTLPQGTSFILIRLADGTKLSHVLTEDTTFEGGKKYLYHITVRQEELVITTTIEDWSVGGEVQGEAGT